MAVELGADLHDFPRLGQAHRPGMEHASGVAQAGDAFGIEQMRVYARDLQRGVGAQAEQPAAQLIDDLEGVQIEFAPGSGQQRFEMLDQGRAHQPIAMQRKVVEQPPADALDRLGLDGQQVVDVLRQQPLAHGQCVRD